MKHLFIKELGFKDHHLVKRRPDGAEEILYQGCSHEECHFQLLKYAEATEAASEERRELPEKFIHMEEQYERARREQMRFLSLHKHPGWWPRKVRQCKNEMTRLGYLAEAYEVLGQKNKK